MKKWDAHDVCLVILTATIPISILIIPLTRMITGAALSDNAASVLNNFTTAIGVGLIGIISGKVSSRSKKEGD